MPSTDGIGADYAAEIEELERLAGEGLTAREISRKTGTPVARVRARARRTEITLAYETDTARRPCDCHEASHMGHRFEDQLWCQCGAHWARHQTEPTPCIGPRRVCVHGHNWAQNAYTNEITGVSYCRTCRRISQRRAI